MAAAVLIKFPGGTPPCDIVAHAYDRAIYLDGLPPNFDFHLRTRRYAFYSRFYAPAAREKYPRSRNRSISRLGHLGIGQRGESAFESTAVTRRVDLSRLAGSTDGTPTSPIAHVRPLVDKWSRCRLATPMREHTLHDRQERFREHRVPPAFSRLRFTSINSPKLFYSKPA